VRTGMYPAFATDLQQPMTSLLLRAPGRSIITDKVFPERYNHIPQLNKMGANISVRNRSAFIQGAAPLQGGYVHASDVRAGTCLIIAGLMAEGVTMISGVEHIERGYDNVMNQFRALGAKLLVHDIQEETVVVADNVNQAAVQ
jgi:UDP-N-acetylglucosamine 1-carboxyvinyltransferase